MSFHVSKFLVVVLTIIPVSDTQRASFWKRYGKKLDISPMSKITISTPEDCLGVCKLYDGCKAFNVNHVTLVCELFYVDRCNLGLVNDRERSYFDSVADFQCPPCK